MEYIAFVFGIFGLMAYLEISSLKKKVQKLEEQLASIEGTPFHEDRAALRKVAKDYVGRKVNIDLKEDQGDVDIMMYGNSKYGANTILDADDDWLLVQVDTPKGSKEKLLRLGSVQRITAVKE